MRAAPLPAQLDFGDGTTTRGHESGVLPASDLNAVLHGATPRLPGAMPPQLGLFERIAPGRPLDAALRQRSRPGR